MTGITATHAHVEVIIVKTKLLVSRGVVFDPNDSSSIHSKVQQQKSLQKLRTLKFT